MPNSSLGNLTGARHAFYSFKNFLSIYNFFMDFNQAYVVFYADSSEYKNLALIFIFTCQIHTFSL